LVWELLTHTLLCLWFRFYIAESLSEFGSGWET
jgi:hypothetical protein